MLINNHILFRDEIVDGSLSRSHSEAKGLPEHSIPPVPLHQQQLLSDIRDARMDVRPDDDNITEGTDVLREAFDFLHTDQPEDEDQDDEIVWDPRSLIFVRRFLTYCLIVFQGPCLSSCHVAHNANNSHNPGESNDESRARPSLAPSSEDIVRNSKHSTHCCSWHHCSRSP